MPEDRWGSDRNFPDMGLKRHLSRQFALLEGREIKVFIEPFVWWVDGLPLLDLLKEEAGGGAGGRKQYIHLEELNTSKNLLPPYHGFRSTLNLYSSLVFL
jgi:hypothetical protein